MPENTSEDHNSCTPFWGAFILAAMATVICTLSAWGITDNAWKAEAVKRGYARWVIENEHGKVLWEWVEK